MGKKSIAVEFRRKREGKTNYAKRIKLIASGKPRVVIRKSLKNITLQLIEYSEGGDRVLCSANSRELIKYGWNLNRGNIPAAYLTGLLLGKKINGRIKEAVLDIGLQEPVKGSRIYAALKGVLDAGFNVRHSSEILPDEKRISGMHISAYAQKLKSENPEMFKKFFSHYADILELGVKGVFEKTKENIIKNAAKNAGNTTKK